MDKKLRSTVYINTTKTAIKMTTSICKRKTFDNKRQITGCGIEVPPPLQCQCRTRSSDETKYKFN